MESDGGNRLFNQAGWILRMDVKVVRGPRRHSSGLGTSAPLSQRREIAGEQEKSQTFRFATATGNPLAEIARYVDGGNAGMDVTPTIAPVRMLA